MYLKYDDYISYGGKMDNANFDRYCFRAGKEIDNATQNKCRELATIPPEFKRCMFELVEYFSKHIQSGSPLAVSSFGNDGYSVSYVDQKTAEQQIYDIIYTYLSGTGLMYCGVD